MNAPASSGVHPPPAAHEARTPDQAHADDPDRRCDTEPEVQALTEEERAALALHHRHLSERSYLPAPVDYLHVR